MGILKHIIEDFRSIVVNSYKDGVSQATPDKIIYIDPNKLKDPDMAKNVAELRRELEKQVPGITGKPGQDDYVSDSDLEDLVKMSVTQGPFAIKGEYNGKKIGLINLQDKSLDHRDEIVPILAGVPLDKLRRIPGDDYIWDKMIGIHEGTHVNQTEIDPTNSSAEIGLDTLRGETGSDQAAINYARSIGREDIVQAWKDYRAMGAVSDPGHATAIFLDSNKEITPAYYEAACKFKDEMDQAVADKLGITKTEAAKLLEDDPKKYIGIIDEKLKEGNIGSTPETTEYIQAFAGAYRRQVIERDLDPPRPKHHGPRADNNVLPEGVRWAELTPRPGQEPPVIVASNDGTHPVLAMNQAEPLVPRGAELALALEAPRTGQEAAIHVGDGYERPLENIDSSIVPADIYCLKGKENEINAMVQDYCESVGVNMSEPSIFRARDVAAGQIAYDGMEYKTFSEQSAPKL